MKIKKFKKKPVIIEAVKWSWLGKPLLILVSIITIIMFLAYPYNSVGQVYLGHYPDEGIQVGSQEWKNWHEIKIAESECLGKETLNTIDVCGGYVTTFCKKRWSWAYNWCEIHCMDNQCHWQWWYE